MEAREREMKKKKAMKRKQERYFLAMFNGARGTTTDLVCANFIHGSFTPKVGKKAAAGIKQEKMRLSDNKLDSECATYPPLILRILSLSLSLFLIARSLSLQSGEREREREREREKNLRMGEQEKRKRQNRKKACCLFKPVPSFVARCLDGQSGDCLLSSIKGLLSLALSLSLSLREYKNACIKGPSVHTLSPFSFLHSSYYHRSHILLFRAAHEQQIQRREEKRTTCRGQKEVSTAARTNKLDIELKRP